MAVTLDSLKKAIKKNKGRSQALAWLADMERASGDYEAALKTVDAALAASPSDVPAMLVRAKILAGQQDFAGSISEYKKVLAKDPFCLSAHKRMGESYDKLGKDAERNACYRRVHDMDPLDPFWKDEYDVLTEEEQASLVPPPMDDNSFTMDVDNDSEATELAEDNVFANLAASLPNTDEEDNSSMDDLRSSLDSASDELSKAGDASADPDFDDQVLNSSEVSSAISGILGGDDDFDIMGGSTEKDEPAEEEPATSSLFSHFNASDDSDSLDEDTKSDELSEELVEDKPSEVSEEKSEESVFSLDSLDEPQQAEPQPAEDAETNVDDAFASLLGEDEAPAEPAVEEPSLEEPAAEESVAEKADEETNVNDAFSSIFGDDELPEETPAEESVTELADETPVETAAEEPAVETAPVEEAAAETPAEEPAEEESFGSLFEKSADADFNMNEQADAAVETAATEDSAEEESLGSLFEKSADADFSLDETPAEQPAEETFAENVPAEEEPAENAVPSMHMDFSEEEAPSKTDDDFILNLDDVAEESTTEETIAESTPVVEEAVAEEPVAEESAAEEVDGAFDALFGEESSEEPAAEEQVAEASVEVAEEPVAAEAPVEVAEEPVAAEAPAEVAEEPVAAEAPAEIAEELVADEAPAEASADEDVAKEMGGAFASMFGDDDALDLPEENKEAPAEVALTEEPLSQEATGAEIEESSVKEDVKDNVEESFDNIFGSGADDDLPEEKSETVELAPASVFTAPAEESVAEPAAAPAASEVPADVEEKPAETLAEAPSAELDSIDSEVSNAFKGLFDEDDSLTEADEPNNKGVDYLMSGDSDDEVSASLVNDADAPLSRGAADLDDSLNTRTLADIYMEQGVYTKALEIYSDLAKKNPNNAEIKSRLEEVEKLCREKFGEG